MTDHAMNVQPSGFRFQCEEWTEAILHCPDPECVWYVHPTDGQSLGQLLGIAKTHLAGPREEPLSDHSVRVPR